MKTKLHKFESDEPAIEVEHDPGDCAMCEAAKLVKWPDEGGVIFFQDERGRVHRVESLPEWTELTGNQVAVMCGEVSPEAARAEILEATQGGA